MLERVALRQPTNPQTQYVCDNVSMVFLASALCMVVNRENLELQWVCVQTLQLVGMFKHFSAFARQSGMRYVLGSDVRRFCCRMVRL